MGIFDKIFHKKKDDFDFDELADKELDNGPFAKKDNLGLDRKPAGLDEKSPFQEEQKEPFPPHLQEVVKPEEKNIYQSQKMQQPLPGRDRDLELINSKLDTLKAILASMDQRIGNLEKAAGVEKKERLW